MLSLSPSQSSAASSPAPRALKKQAPTLRRALRKQAQRALPGASPNPQRASAAGTRAPGAQEDRRAGRLAGRARPLPARWPLPPQRDPARSPHSLPSHRTARPASGRLLPAPLAAAEVTVDPCAHRGALGHESRTAGAGRLDLREGLLGGDRRAPWVTC